MNSAHRVLSAAERETIRQAARDHEPDWYLTALLAPRGVRDDLVTLAAFFGDIARIPLVVSDPMLGEIRLQWWRDAIEAREAGVATGNPIADELTSVIARRNLLPGSVLAVLDGCSAELTDSLSAGEAAFATHLDQAYGSMFQLCARVLGAEATPDATRAIEAAGRAYGNACAALRLPVSLSKGRLPLPLDFFGGADPRHLPLAGAQSAVRAANSALAGAASAQLADARRQLANLPRPLIAAFLPLALVEPYFRALQKAGHDPIWHTAEISPIERATRLWLARFTRRV